MTEVSPAANLIQGSVWARPAPLSTHLCPSLRRRRWLLERGLRRRLLLQVLGPPEMRILQLPRRAVRVRNDARNSIITRCCHHYTDDGITSSFLRCIVLLKGVCEQQ